MSIVHKRNIRTIKTDISPFYLSPWESEDTGNSSIGENVTHLLTQSLFNILEAGVTGWTRRYQDVNRMLQRCGSRGERIVFWWPNTNTNIIRFPRNDRIWILILFGFPEMTEYEYEYYSATQKWPNTNTNIIRFPNNDQKQITRWC